MKQKNMRVKDQREKRREGRTSYDSKHGGKLVNGTGGLRVTYSLDTQNKVKKMLSETILSGVERSER